jgi:hypothetical protein
MYSIYRWARQSWVQMLFFDGIECLAPIAVLVQTDVAKTSFRNPSGFRLSWLTRMRLTQAKFTC